MPATLDPAGRPYDVPLADGHVVRRQRLGSLSLAGRPLVIGPGEGFLGTYDLVPVPLPATATVDVDAVLAGPPGSDSVAGIVLQVPGAQVATWGSFESAYGTDGGMGGVWAPDAAQVSAGSAQDWHPTSPQAFARLQDGADWVLVDADGDGGDDGLLFANGWGDGGFPMTRGTDAQGRVVAVTIWHLWVPWRLAVTGGTPPPDVTEAEDLVARCLASGGTPLLDGGCAA